MKMATAERTLPEICSLVTDGTHDSPKLQTEGIPFIKGKNISSGRIDFENCDFITEEDHAKCIKRVKPQPGDVLFANIGSVGDVALVKEEREFSIKNVALFRPDGDKVDIRYFYYLVSSPIFKGGLLNVKSGAAQPFISLESFRRQRFRIQASKQAQRRIGSILSNYDDLIENNLRRIKLLEESARLLYEEWFVRLRFPGYEHTRIVKGVPEGWESGTIADFYETASGGTPSRKKPEYFEGDTLWVKTQELQNDFLIETQERITDQAIRDSAARVFPEGTVLIAMYGATIGQLGILAFPSATNQACCAIIPRYQGLHYIYAFLFLLENKQRLISLAQGAAQKNVNQEVIKSYPMISPSKTVMTQFVESLRPSFEMRLNLQLQNKKLREASDILLPKLMSGEIKV